MGFAQPPYRLGRRGETQPLTWGAVGRCWLRLTRIPAELRAAAGGPPSRHDIGWALQQANRLVLVSRRVSSGTKHTPVEACHRFSLPLFLALLASRFAAPHPSLGPAAVMHRVRGLRGLSPSLRATLARRDYSMCSACMGDARPFSYIHFIHASAARRHNPHPPTLGHAPWAHWLPSTPPAQFVQLLCRPVCCAGVRGPRSSCPLPVPPRVCSLGTRSVSPWPCN